MAFKVFLDVNVILDFILQRDGYQPSKTIISWAEEGKINGFVLVGRTIDSPNCIKDYDRYCLNHSLGNCLTLLLIITLSGIGKIYLLSFGGSVYLFS